MSPGWDAVLQPPSAIFDVRDRFAGRLLADGAVARPYRPLRFLLIATVAAGGRTEPLRRPLELITVENPSGYRLCFGETRQRDRVRRVAGGRYLVRIESPLYRRDEFQATLLDPEDARYSPPARPVIRELEPGHGYPFPNGGRGATVLVGSLHHSDGRVVEGAAVAVAGRAGPYVTDQTGQWLLDFPDDQPSGPVTVAITLPDGTPTMSLAGVELRRGRQATLTQPALRGAVRVGGRGAAGAVITVSGQPSSTTSAPDGGWRYHFRPDQPDATVDVTASLPDGRSATRPGVPVRARGVTVVDTFEVPER